MRPEPGRGQVLVRPLATGICGSDLHAMEVQAEDPVAYPPMVLGMIADGTVDVGRWITATRDLDHVDAAFADLRAADAHCTIIVAPQPARLNERSNG